MCIVFASLIVTPCSEFRLDRPLVSIIIPCFQEGRTIGRLLGAIRHQTYPMKRMEVVIADGLSTDQTREEIDSFRESCPDLEVRVLDNPKRIIPAALNLAIRGSLGEILLRLDGHSMPSPAYVATCVDLLRQGRGDMVGGVWSVEPGDSSWQARSIAAAASHPVGVGDAYYRWATTAREVDTLAFWALSRSWFERVGYFDETLFSNEDYDFNSRFRAAGGKIWLDPSIACVYFARNTFSSLARQYWRYGFWKARMARRKPKTLRWRQVLPPLGVVVVATSLMAGLFFPLAWWILGVALSTYLLGLFAAGIQYALKRGRWDLAFGFPIAIPLMHVVWGSAFLAGLVSGSERR